MTRTLREDLVLFRGVGRNFLRPERRREDEVRAIVGATRSVVEVWERLSTRGVLPHRWLDEPARSFLREPFATYGTRGLGNAVANAMPRPPSVEAAVTMASDVPGVERAEEAVRTWHVRQKQFFDLPPLRGFVWRVLPVNAIHPAQDIASMDHYLMPAVGLAVGRMGGIEDLYAVDATQLPPEIAAWKSPYDVAGRAVVSGRMSAPGRARSVSEPIGQQVDPQEHAVFWYAVNAAIQTDRFAHAQRLGAVLDPQERLPRLRKSTPLADLYNPFAPLLDVYAAGYVFQRLYRSGYGANQELRAILVAPAANPDRLPKAVRELR